MYCICPWKLIFPLATLYKSGNMGLKCNVFLHGHTEILIFIHDIPVMFILQSHMWLLCGCGDPKWICVVPCTNTIIMRWVTFKTLRLWKCIVFFIFSILQSQELYCDCDVQVKSSGVSKSLSRIKLIVDLRWVTIKEYTMKDHFATKN